MKKIVSVLSHRIRHLTAPTLQKWADGMSDYRLTSPTLGLKNARSLKNKQRRPIVIPLHAAQVNVASSHSSETAFSPRLSVDERQEASLLVTDVPTSQREQALDVMRRLSAAASFRDPETGNHLRRMSSYAKVIAKRLGTSKEFQEVLLLAAPMHDIGKIGIPDQILLKHGRLTAAEMEVMKKHSEIGYQILKGGESPLIDLAALIAWTHHEKFDGSGYPRGLKGCEIPLAGRIVAVADVFDALTSSRPYKRAWSIEHALNFLSLNKGSHFDPDCVAALLDCLPEVIGLKHEFAE